MMGLREWKYCTVHVDLEPGIVGKHKTGDCIVCNECKLRVIGSLSAHKKAMHYKVEKDACRVNG